jgi:hypothetical protein
VPAHGTTAASTSPPWLCVHHIYLYASLPHSLVWQTNAAIAKYLGYDAWHLHSRAGATIKTAFSFNIALSPGANNPREIVSYAAQVAGAFSDPTGECDAHVVQANPQLYMEPWFIVRDRSFVLGGVQGL